MNQNSTKQSFDHKIQHQIIYESRIEKRECLSYLSIKQDQIHTNQISTFLDIASFPERPEPKGPALSSKKWSCCLAIKWFSFRVMRVKADQVEWLWKLSNPWYIYAICELEEKVEALKLKLWVLRFQYCNDCRFSVCSHRDGQSTWDLNEKSKRKKHLS